MSDKAIPAFKWIPGTGQRPELLCSPCVASRALTDGFEQLDIPQIVRGVLRHASSCSFPSLVRVGRSR